MQPDSSDSDKAALAGLEQMSSNKDAADILGALAKDPTVKCATAFLQPQC